MGRGREGAGTSWLQHNISNGFHSRRQCPCRKFIVWCRPVQLLQCLHQQVRRSYKHGLMIYSVSQGWVVYSCN